MTEKFDEGDLAETVSVPIREDDTALSLYGRTILASLEMVERFLLDRLAGKPIPRIPQQGEPKLSDLSCRATIGRCDGWG